MRNIGLIQTEVHEISYGTNWPLRQLLGVRQVDDTTSNTSADTLTSDKLAIIENSVKAGTDLTECITELKAMKTQAEIARTNYQAQLNTNLTTLQIQQINLAIKQEESNLAEIQRVTDLAEIALKEKRSKYFVYGGVAVAGLATVGLIIYSLKKK